MKRMKKLLIGFFTFCMVLIGVIAIPKSAQAADSDFVIENGVLTKYTGSGGNVVIPNGVTRIGDYAFWGCTDLTNVTLSNSITEIGWGAFIECSSLTSITIPNSVTKIGSSVFDGCTNLKEINVNSGNPCYSSKDGIMYNKNKTILICCPNGKTYVSVIPNSVTKIGDGAFLGNANLTNITIPNSVTEIGYSTFAGCLNLVEITILNPNSILFYKNTDMLNYGDGWTQFNSPVVTIWTVKSSLN